MGRRPKLKSVVTFGLSHLSCRDIYDFLFETAEKVLYCLGARPAHDGRRSTRNASTDYSCTYSTTLSEQISQRGGGWRDPIIRLTDTIAATLVCSTQIATHTWCCMHRPPRVPRARPTEPGIQHACDQHDSTKAYVCRTKACHGLQMNAWPHLLNLAPGSTSGSARASCA